MDREDENSEAMKYVKSLRDSVKRRFAVAYLAWIRSGRAGSVPPRGALSPVLARAVTANLDALS